MREKTVMEIMKSKVETLGRNDTLDIASDVMALGRLRHLPVVDEGLVVGVVSQRDLFQRSLGAALGYGEVSHKKLLHTILVKEVMNEPAITVGPGATVKEAGRIMLEKRIGCLPVVENGALVGIVSETDILRHLIGVPVGSELKATHPSEGMPLSRRRGERTPIE